MSAARYVGPDWAMWCSSAATGKFLVVRPELALDVTVMATARMLDRRGGYKVVFGDSDDVEFKADLTPLTTDGASMIVACSDVRPAVLSPYAALTGTYILPMLPEGMRAARTGLYYRMAPAGNHDGPTLYLAPIKQTPTATKTSVMFMDPFGEIHTAEVCVAQNYDIPIEFVS